MGISESQPGYDRSEKRAISSAGVQDSTSPSECAAMRVGGAPERYIVSLLIGVSFSRVRSCLKNGRLRKAMRAAVTEKCRQYTSVPFPVRGQSFFQPSSSSLCPAQVRILWLSPDEFALVLRLWSVADLGSDPERLNLWTNARWSTAQSVKRQDATAGSTAEMVAP